MAFWCPDNYQENKQQGVGYGHLPAHNVQVVPWYETNVDLIGGFGPLS